MVSAAEVRAWAREEGRDVPGKGKLSQALFDDYAAAHPGSGAVAGDMFAGDFVPGAGHDEPDAGGPPGAGIGEPYFEEERPRTLARPAGKGWRGRLWDGKRPQGRGKPRKRRPRVPVDGMIAYAWSLLANMAKPIPPTARILKMQAPVAGLVLETHVKDTAIDVVLQPFARAGEMGKVVAALVVPPAVVTAITMQPALFPVLLPVLREAMLAWDEIAGDKYAELERREADFEERHGKKVDDMIAEIFDGVFPDEPGAGQPDDPGAAARDGQARAVQGLVAAP